MSKNLEPNEQRDPEIGDKTIGAALASTKTKVETRLDEVLVRAAKRLRDAVDDLRFTPPVSYTYNPLRYAWAPHEMYLRQFAAARKRVVFLGMNPGPFGMAQTGVPFGEIRAVRDWLGIKGAVGKPTEEHPSRLITGFACARSEISGQRLWGLFADRFQNADAFFREHMVLNYCPLAFLEESGRNRTPDKLLPEEKRALFEICDEHLKRVVVALEPEWVIGIGAFAAMRAREALRISGVRFGQILHPSPASPAANKNWAAMATRQLHDLKVWERDPAQMA